MGTTKFYSVDILIKPLRAYVYHFKKKKYTGIPRWILITQKPESNMLLLVNLG